MRYFRVESVPRRLVRELASEIVIYVGFGYGLGAFIIWLVT